MLIQRMQRRSRSVLEFVALFCFAMAGGNVPHEIFVAVPEIEIVFLQDRALFERLVQRSLSDLEWRLAQLSPKETITSLVRPSSSVMDLLAQLTERDIAVLRQHELIKGISDFSFQASELDRVSAACL